MSIQINSVSLESTEPLTVIKNEPPESEIVGGGMGDILDSLELKEEIIPDIKDDIVYHPLCGDLIKSETIPENVLESKHLESVETIFVKIENTPFVKIENVTESDILNKTVDIGDSNVNKSTDQGVVEVQGSNKHFNTFDNFETNKQLVVNFPSDLNGISATSRKAKQPEKENFAKYYKTVETASWDKEKVKVIEAPVISIEPHEYTSLADDKHVCNHCQHASNNLYNLKLHIKKMHREVTTMYQCPYCPYKSKWSIRNHIIHKHKDTKGIQCFQCHLCEKKFKLKHLMIQHAKIHLTLEPMQDSNKIEFCPLCGKEFSRTFSAKRHMKFVHNKEEKNKGKRKCRECEYSTTERKLLEHHIKNTHKKYEKSYDCDRCDYKTCRFYTLKIHKLTHLKPEDIQYLYCYHCSYKSAHKENLKRHILMHFRNGDVSFHCYICDFMTLKKELIIDHIKKHSKVQIKSEIIEGS